MLIAYSRTACREATRPSNAEADVNDIAVLNDIVFALDAAFTGVFRALFAAVLDKVFVGGYFHTNKAAASQVAVDFSGGRWSF